MWSAAFQVLQADLSERESTKGTSSLSVGIIRGWAMTSWKEQLWDPLLNSIPKYQRERIPTAFVASIHRKNALSSGGEYFSKCLSPFLVMEGENSLCWSRVPLEVQKYGFNGVCNKCLGVKSWNWLFLARSRWESLGGSDRSWWWHVNASLLQSSEESVTTTTWISALSMPGLDCGTAFSLWSTPSSISAFWWSSLKGSYLQEVVFWSDYSSNGKITHSTSSLITNLLQNVFCEMRQGSFWFIVPAWKKFSDFLGFVSKLEPNSNWYIFM